jgi:iron complex transport system permease protein
VRRTLLVPIALASLGLGLFAVSLFVGTSSLDDTRLRSTLFELRISRAAVAYLAGAALAVGGVIVQGLFRNPLASPDVLGTTAGASFVGKLSLLGFQALLVNDVVKGIEPEMLLPFGCLAGAMGALLVLLAIARSQPDTVVLLLSGFLLSSLFLAMGSFVTSIAQESWEVGRAVISFALGSVAGAGQRQAAIILPIAVFGTLAAMAWARPLDLLLSGEDEARMLGVDVKRTRRYCIIWAAVLTAGAVSVGGNVGFVGLVVPHGLRRLVGVSHRALVPAAALGGGAFLLACDVLARAIPSRTEIPLGVITGVVGAPLFLWLLLRARRETLYG